MCTNFVIDCAISWILKHYSNYNNHKSICKSSSSISITNKVNQIVITHKTTVCYMYICAHIVHVQLLKFHVIHTFYKYIKLIRSKSLNGCHRRFIQSTLNQSVEHTSSRHSASSVSRLVLLDKINKVTYIHAQWLLGNSQVHTRTKFFSRYREVCVQ